MKKTENPRVIGKKSSIYPNCFVFAMDIAIAIAIAIATAITTAMAIAIANNWNLCW